MLSGLEPVQGHHPHSIIVALAALFGMVLPIFTVRFLLSAARHLVATIADAVAF